MIPQASRRTRLTEADLNFVLEETTPKAQHKEPLRKSILEDDNFRKTIIGDDRVFQRVMNDDEIFVKISPSLYFEVLLRRTLKDLSVAVYTVEYSGRQGIPVFDTHEVVQLLERPGVLEYMGDLLASFTRIQSHVVLTRIRRGVRRRLKYSDLDVAGAAKMNRNACESTSAKTHLTRKRPWWIVFIRSCYDLSPSPS